MMTAAKSKNDNASNTRIAISNRKAYHEFSVLDSLEVGIALTGTEIKSLRKGRASLNEAHARIEKGQVWLYGLNISPYEAGTYNNHDPLRARRLLLHKKQITKFHQAVQEKGLTLIPLRLYFARCWVKIELGLCQGKKLHDKRDALKEKQTNREMQREVKNVNFKNH
jgi:SsrA-binding protein